MDSAQLRAVVSEIKARAGNVHSMVVIRNGAIVAEANSYPFRADIPHELWSATKSVTATLIGLALYKGYLESLDQPVLDFFPKRSVASLSENKRAVTLKHLLTMTSGESWPGIPGSVAFGELLRSPDWVQFLLDLPVDKRLGGAFKYGTGYSHLLMGVLETATEMTPLDFASEHLFKPLGISDVVWRTDPCGLPIGGYGLRLRPRDLAKLGYLYLRQGVWEGERLLSSAWVHASTAPQVPAGFLTSHYSYHWWVEPPGLILAAGSFGQTLAMIPNLDLLVVLTAGNPDYRLPIMLIEQLLSAVVSSEPQKESYALGRLQEEIKAVETPKPVVKPIVPRADVAWYATPKTYVLEDKQAFWEAFSFSFKGDEAALHISFREGEQSLRVGTDGLYRTSFLERFGPLMQHRDSVIDGIGPSAQRGHWQSRDTFVLEQLYLWDMYRAEYTFRFYEGGADIAVSGNRVYKAVTPP